VVEHDEEVMETADYIVDIGPHAGKHGGEIIFQGTYQEMVDCGTTETSQYVSGKKQISRENCHHEPTGWITIE
jgi:excinuclease ABC subunit A